MRPISRFKYMLIFGFCLWFGLFSAGCSSESEAVNENDGYTLPELVIPQYSGEDSVSSAEGGFDLSGANNGYIMANYTGSVPAKLQISKDGAKYNYDISQTGEYEIFPLQMGSGTYTVKLLTSVGDNRYTTVLNQDVEASIASEFAPFLIPNQIVNYNAGTSAVTFAREQAAKSGAEADVIKAIYAHIKENVTYDVEKAQNPPVGYIPTVDDTFVSDKGICFDYASLAAAMLRSCGIPTKVETGYISPSGIYHAWNRIYVKNAGWVDVGFKIDPNTWTLLDTTFAASSGNSDLSSFIGDGDKNTYEMQYTY